MSEDIVGFRVQGLGLMGQEGATKKCGNCHKLLLLLLFATKPKTTELYGTCNPCRLENADRKRKKYAAAKATRNAALEADVTPTTLDCERCGPKPFAAFGLHPTTGNPLTRCKPCNEKKNAQDAEYQKTELGKAANKRHKATEKGKASRKRANTSEKGKACAKRAKAMPGKQKPSGSPTTAKSAVVSHRRCEWTMRLFARRTA